LFNKFSVKLKNTILVAQSETYRMRRERVIPAHVLLALALGKDEVGLVLNQQGVDPLAVRKEISEGSYSSERSIADIEFSETAREMMELAFKASAADASPELTNAHVLYALLVEDASCSVVELLKSLGVDLGTLRRRIDIILKLSERSSLGGTAIPVHTPGSSPSEPSTSESKFAVTDVFDEASVSLIETARMTARALSHSSVRHVHLLAAFAKLGSWREYVTELMSFVGSDELLDAILIEAGENDDSPIDFADDIKGVLVSAKDLARVNSKGLIEPVMLLYGMAIKNSSEFFKQNGSVKIWQLAQRIRKDVLTRDATSDLSSSGQTEEPPKQSSKPELKLASQQESIYFISTERLVRVLRFAKAEALLSNQSLVEAPHLVLAMIRESFFSEIAFVKYRESDVEQLKKSVCRERDTFTHTMSINEATSEIKLSPRSRELLLLARDQARELRLPYIDLNHLAIALLEAEDWLPALIADSEFSSAGALVKRLKQCSLQQHHLLNSERGNNNLPMRQPLTLDDVDNRLDALGAFHLLPPAEVSLEERLDRRSEVVMGYAVEESRKLGLSQISIETIMLGLLYETFGPTFQVFNVLDLNLLDAREVLTTCCGRISERAAALRPLSRNAVQVMECAWRFAKLMKSTQIAPEHILLAVAEESDGIASFVCEALAIDAKLLRAELIAAMNSFNNPPIKPR
jgi:ATP-dependent Clp protease ATP-binding subunit ClpA